MGDFFEVHALKYEGSGLSGLPGLPGSTKLLGLSTTKSLLESDERQWSTPLAKQLGEAISTTGPIPLASFMRMCLTSDLGGYYTGAIEAGRDQFGAEGDFVTSPEISQIFGELVGIWFVAEWIAQGRQSEGVELIEVGPGRGTLMDDMLRTIQKFPAMAKAIETIYLVEASARLREAQRKRLCGNEAPMTESNMGWHSPCKYGSIQVVWTETIQGIPKTPEKMPLIVAHEFFDALPIHAFQSVEISGTAKQETSASKAPSSSPPPSSRSKPSPPTGPTIQWRELLVSPTPPGSTHASLGTPASQSRDTPPPDFQLTVARAATRHSLLLPDASARYRDILRLHRPAASQPPGAVSIEVCPDAILHASDFSIRIGGGGSRAAGSREAGKTYHRLRKARPSGAALILDYGPGDGSVPANSLRGIRRHRRVSPFAEPGLTDLSADVDFAAVAEAALAASEGVEVHGPVEQGPLLETMGIRERAEQLVRAARRQSGELDAAPDLVEKAWKRLVDRGPNGMGRVYKALAIVPENGGRRRPVGFGGDVVE